MAALPNLGAELTFGLQKISLRTGIWAAKHVAFARCSRKGGVVVFQALLTGMIALAIGLLAFSAYGSLTAALVLALTSALLWFYLVRL